MSQNSLLEQDVRTLKVLGHPVRLQIIDLLAKQGELNVGAIQDELDLAQSTVSQHISKMREAAIITDRRDGTRIYYTLSDDTARRIVDSLASSRQQK